MVPSRRRTLQTLGSGFALILAGCTADSASTSTASRTIEPTTETTTEKATDSPSPTPTSQAIDVEPAGPKRASGEPIAIDRTVTDEDGYDDDFEYFPENESVRFVFAVSGSEPAEFRTVPFDRWAETEAASFGERATRNTTADRTGVDAFTTGFGHVTEVEGVDRIVILVSVRFLLDREGNVIESPDVPLSMIVESAPETVTVDMTVEDRQYEKTFDVFCKRSVHQYE